MRTLSVMNSNDTGNVKENGKVLPQKKNSPRLNKCNNNHVLVQHCYHDRAEEPPSPYCFPHEAKASFPLKLYRALSRLEEDGHSDLMSWQPHGRCFVIQQTLPVVRLRQFLPDCFDGISKITSFQRQLNLYGFKRITQGLDKGGYYHEYFLRGKQHLVYNIHRIKVKGTRVRGKPNPDQEPDFWTMPWLVGGDRSESLADAPVNPFNHELSATEEAQQPQDRENIPTNEKEQTVASFTQPCFDAFDYDTCKTDGGAFPANTTTTSLGFMCPAMNLFQSPNHQLYQTQTPLIPQEQHCYEHQISLASPNMTNISRGSDWDPCSTKQTEEDQDWNLALIQSPSLEDWLGVGGLDDLNLCFWDSEQVNKNNSGLKFTLHYNDSTSCHEQEAVATTVDL